MSGVNGVHVTLRVDLDARHARDSVINQYLQTEVMTVKDHSNKGKDAKVPDHVVSLFAFIFHFKQVNASLSLSTIYKVRIVYWGRRTRNCYNTVEGFMQPLTDYRLTVVKTQSLD